MTPVVSHHRMCIILKIIVLVAVETNIVVKQEKTEDVKVALESQKVLPKVLQSCFCPHGFSSANYGHYHCRHCGLSCRLMHNVLKHEKVHTASSADKPARPKQPSTGRFYSCRYCGYLSRYSTTVKRHEKKLHAKSHQLKDKQVVTSSSATTPVGTDIMLETTANRLGVSVNKY